MILYYFLNTINPVFKIILENNYITTINLIIYDVNVALLSCAKVAERLRNRLQSDSNPVRLWALAFFFNGSDLLSNDILKFNKDNSAYPVCGDSQVVKGDRLKICFSSDSRVRLPFPA
jgi:hypothetical protein